MTDKRGKIIVVSAPSGAGKSTLLKQLFEAVPELEFSTSATTRQPREGEKNGIDYHFLSHDEFEQKIHAGEFVEWEQFFNHYYGTLRSVLDEALEEGKMLMLELDVKGAISIKRAYPEASLIFIDPPSIAELENRLRGRNTEDEEQLNIRMERAMMEMGYRDNFDFIIENNQLKQAAEELKKTVETIINEE